MDRTVIIKNNLNEYVIYGSQGIDANSSYEVEDDSALERMRDSDPLKSAIYSGDASIGDGSKYYDVNDAGYRWLMGSPPIDEHDSKPIYRNSIALDGRHFEPGSFDFWTATYNSLYNKKCDAGSISSNTDYNDASLKFYNSSNSELSYQQEGYESETEAEFQTRLDNNCTKTICRWIPTYDYEPRSGKLQILDAPTTHNTYAWVLMAGHISEEYGGSVPFLGRGFNLRFVAPKGQFNVDGNTTVPIEVDTEYYSHGIDIVIMHETGDKFGVQLILEHYKE